MLVTWWAMKIKCWLSSSSCGTCNSFSFNVLKNLPAFNEKHKTGSVIVFYIHWCRLFECIAIVNKIIVTMLHIKLDIFTKYTIQLNGYQYIFTKMHLSICVHYLCVLFCISLIWRLPQRFMPCIVYFICYYFMIPITIIHVLRDKKLNSSYFYEFLYVLYFTNRFRNAFNFFWSAEINHSPFLGFRLVYIKLNKGKQTVH